MGQRDELTTGMAVGESEPELVCPSCGSHQSLDTHSCTHCAEPLITSIHSVARFDQTPAPLPTSRRVGSNPPAPKSQVDGVAIASFVFSILWLYGLGSLLGFALGLVSLHRIRESGRRGHALAMAGAWVGAIGFLVTVTAAIIVYQTVKDGL